LLFPKYWELAYIKLLFLGITNACASVRRDERHNILSEFDEPMRLIRAVKIF
jgi:hypothetical protein